MSTDASVQPEGIEDLAVFGGTQLAEVCQVKSVAEPLAVHHLRSARGSFFTRAAAVLRTDPTAVLRIVSFGPVGPELAKAIAADGPERDRVVAKLSGDASASAEEIRNVLVQLQPVEEVTETQLSGAIGALLSQLVTGIDAKTSMDVLLFWVYRTAEARISLARAQVEQQLVDIGRYLAERAAHHAEWFTTVEPLSYTAIDRDRAAELAGEFHRGMQARWEHVVAGITVPRPGLLGRVIAALDEKRVAIIHGASGQGKSTLAYQFMYELPEAWRFRVRRVDDREHAARLAVLLGSFGRTLGLPVYILVDVRPSDASWPDLVARLYEEPQLRVLVAIREEDWRRTEPSSAVFDFADVALHELQRSDAAEIFRGLDLAVRSPELLDFEHAWAKFGGEGPLLEFVHLATQGSTLRDVLREQLRRLEDEVRQGLRPAQEIDLLRHVAVASAYGARLRLADLVAAVSLPGPARAVELLEREYLVRLEEGGAAITGLHPVRSEIMAELLTDPTVEPWIATARSCLQVAYDEDLEAFLLHAFSRRPELRDDLRAATTALVAKTWRAIAGVGRALVWLGVATYANANRGLLDRLYEAHGDSYTLFIDWDIAGVMPGVADEIVETMARIAHRGEDLRAAAAAARAEQRPTAEIWEPLVQWLVACRQPTQQPQDGDWSDVGLVLFWAGHLRLQRSLDDWLSEDAIETVWAGAPLRAIADLMLGCHAAGSRHLIQLQRARDKSTRVHTELLIARIEDDGSRVIVHFLVPIDDSTVNDEAEDTGIHALTMERVELVRGLWPERDVWGSQGYGHRVLDIDHDATTKAIPRRSMPVHWLTSINGLLAGYEGLRRRPSDWAQFRADLARKRQSTRTAFGLVVNALRRYHRSSSDRVIGFSLDAEGIDKLRVEVDTPLLLPRAAVDEWGFVTESSGPAADESSRALRLALRRFKPLVAAKREWTASVSNALQQVPRCLAVEPLLARGQLNDEQRTRLKEQAESMGVGVDLGPLTSLNVRDAYWRLGRLQAQSRRFFEDVDPSLANAERLETTQYLRFGSVWEQFLARPGSRIDDVVADSEKRRDRRVRQLIGDLDRLAIVEGSTRCRVLSADQSWNDSPSLYIAFDSTEDATVHYPAAEALIQQVRALLRGESTIAARLTALTFRNLVVILLTRGKLVTPEGFVFNILDLQGDRELTSIDFIPKQMPPDTISVLSLEAPADPILDEANLLLAAVGGHWTIAAHAADLMTAGEADDAAAASIKKYIDALGSRLSRTVGDEMLHMRRLDDWASKQGDSSGAADLRGALQELWSQVVPEAETTMVSVQEIADARARLEGARNLALLTRSFVANLVLQPGAELPT